MLLSRTECVFFSSRRRHTISDRDWSSDVCSSDLARDDYADPVGSIQKEYQGRWIAGFASVGNTGFVVVVQQSYKEARAVDPSTFWNLTVWTAAVIFLAVVIVAWVLRRWFRRSNAPNIVV